MTKRTESRKLPVRWWVVAGVLVGAPLLGRVVAAALGAVIGPTAALIGLVGGAGVLMVGSMFWLGFRHRGTTGPVLPLRRFRDRDPAVVDRDGREFDAVYGIQTKVYGFLIVVVVIALVVVGITNLFR